MSIFYGQYTSWWWLFVPSLFVASPAQYESCDFEEGLCIWDLRSLSSLKWVRTNQTQITNTDPLKGPGRDHSSNSASGMIFRQIRRPFCIFDTEAMLLLLTASIWNAFVLEIKGRFKKKYYVIVFISGHFLYVTVPDEGLKRDWASFQSHSLEPTNSSHPCKVSPKLMPSFFSGFYFYCFTVVWNIQMLWKGKNVENVIHKLN